MGARVERTTRPDVREEKGKLGDRTTEGEEGGEENAMEEEGGVASLGPREHDERNKQTGCP